MPIPDEVDIFHDPSFKTLAHRLREEPGFEPLIKAASLDVEEHAALPDSAFAWGDRRLYPLHTPEHAALSYLYATSKTASVPEAVLTTLKNTLEVYGVNPPEAVKQAAAEDNLDDYILPDHKRWKVTSEETLKLAEQALREYGPALSLHEQVAAACRLVKKAEHFKVQPDVTTEKLAGLLVSDLDTARHWIGARATVAPEPLKPVYEKLAADLAEAGPVSSERAALVKLASLLSDLDTKAGLTTAYGHKLPSPMDTVFNTEKRAEAMIDLAGTNVALSKMASLPTHVYADIFGDDVLPEITDANGYINTQKLATVIPTMPSDLKRVFARQMGAYLR